MGEDRGSARRVIVLGGYGGFGGRVALLLARAGFAVTVAGRDGAKAEAFCRLHPKADFAPLALDRNGGLADTLADAPAWLVVDAAGPFQGNDTRVAEACIAAGAHYFDLADARAFVTGIGRLDEAARAADVTVISGVSSLPALSSAVANHLAAGLDRVTRIDTALSASNRASGGTSTTRAILSYVGRPIRLWRGQAWREAFGWQERAKVTFAIPGHRPLRRRVALCDVPDLDLLPDLYPGRPAVRFRAGTEIEIQNIALWLLSWPVRWKWVRGLAALVRPGVWAQKALGRIGGDRSAMAMDVKGWRGGDPIHRRWTVIAEKGDGPWIPAMAAALLAERLQGGEVAPGARTAAGSLALADFECAFADFAIASATEEERVSPLYARIMGDGFARLPETVRALHLVNGELAAAGAAEVIRGRSLPARLIGWIAGFPPAGRTDLRVRMDEVAGVETWHRDFGGHAFFSRLSQHEALVVERFGPIRFAMALPNRADGLSMHIVKWWLGPVRMPLILAPRCVAVEREADGLFHFDVAIRLPIVGPLVHYRGWLTPPAEA
jgi:NAD(P)-dependent dehydrogenase (short-subunit alcohol dehydrogenase family)